MSPYSHYIDCLNCGNELISINELTFRTPQKLCCDYCGMEYKKIPQRVKRTKWLVGISFLAVLLAIVSLSNFTAGLFSVLSLLIVYYFILGIAIKKSCGL